METITKKYISELVSDFTESNLESGDVDRVQNVMDLVFELVLRNSASHVEAIGIIECIKAEMQESFKESYNNKSNFIASQS